MRFYTNVQLVGNQFLVRGYDNGKRFTDREEWRPTLFVDAKKKSKYQTLDGKPVEPPSTNPLNPTSPSGLLP